MPIVNKAKTAALIFTVLLMTSVLMITLPVQPAEAQYTKASQQPYIGELKSGDTAVVNQVTRAFLSFEPNPIGVGQELLVNFWINPALATNNFIIPDGGYVITITPPDGTKDVRTMRSEPATAANYFTYVPTTVGTYSVKFEFLGTYFPAGRYYDGYIITNTTGGTLNTISTYYKPSSTGEQNFTVQQDLVLSWPLTMPTDYWTRPVSINNRGWWPVLGNWPGTGYNGYNNAAMWDQLYPNTPKQIYPGTDFTPWVQAPNTAHVLWKRQGAIAGLTGGPATQYSITSSPGSPSVIYAGRCYQTMTIPINGIPTSCAVCYDLYTGEQYYAIPTAAPTYGITPNLIAYVNPQPSGTGTIASEELGSSTWSVELLSLSGSYLRKINPLTGALAGNYSIAPLSGGTYVNQIGGYVWTIQDLGAAAGTERYRLINWTTRGTSNNIASRIVSNTTWYLQPTYRSPGVSQLPLMYDFNLDLGATVTDFFHAGVQNLTGQPFGNIRWWINCCFFRLSTGQLLYNMTTDTYPDILYQDGDTVSMNNGRVAAWTQGGYYVIFDGTTGTWFRSETADYPWATAGFGAYSSSSAYGMVFRYAYNYVYAYNWTDGKIVWKYEAPSPPFESPYTDVNGSNVYSFNGDGDIADGKLFVSNTEHTPTYPLTRGWGIHCINITNGELVWKLDNPMSFGAVANGYLVAANSWDGYMYVIGRGKSATTVTAPDVAVPLGTDVVIKGTVLDQSPAQPGTPCVSKESMSQQMEYLHLQQPIGGLWNNVTITGVPVSLTAIGSDGTSIDLGTVTSNGYSGVFSLTWTPPKEDTYEIIASFGPDDSYGSSMSTTTLAVGPAPEPYPSPIEPAVPVDNSMLLYAILVLVVIAIIIGITALLRKR